MVDEKGRVYIPSEARKRLGVRRGTRLRLSVEDSRIMLVVEEPRPRLVRRGRGWGPGAFLDAGEALAAE